MTSLPPNNSQMSSQRDKIPRDSKVMELILRSAGVEDFEPKVIQQLLEFAHRYTVDVIQDALAYAEHTGKNEIDIDDVKLAIQGRINHSFTAPPRQEFLVQLAKEQNKEPLPPVPLKYGLRLPPEKHCLTALNFQLVPEQPLPLSSQRYMQEDTIIFTQAQEISSQIVPSEPDDVMTEVQHDDIDELISTNKKTDSEPVEMDYEAESPNSTTGLNENFKRPAEDDEYDDF
ncbi:13118_t:CDS:2 [Acaulospora colombiana]|uniref:13118_t:CDS:1 n=1 Tax=Acaulospora colombiana TaxID=27376 RepID=A0ACA9M524_9GLOM|nr:13118_t:CDS:2 [Acaulospora colombiana]